MKKVYIPFIVLAAAIGVSCERFATAPVADEQGTLAINSDTGDVQEHFVQMLRAGVIARVGQPFEGFVPFMYLQAFPGLVPGDFDGADALLGQYKLTGNEIQFIVDEGFPIHSAADAISDEGMQTVFANIQKRTNVLLNAVSEVDELLRSLSATPGLASTECLPGQRDVDACIEIYQPVCGTVNVQCVTTPCEPVQDTFENSCKACTNSMVSSYTSGACAVN